MIITISIKYSIKRAGSFLGVAYIIILLATKFPSKVEMRSVFWLRAQDGRLIY